MSGFPEAGGVAGAGRGGDPAALTPDAIEAILRDFRAWLAAQETGDKKQETVNTAASPLSPVPCPLSPEIDLFTLVGQFTALRHEVNLQTKAARAAVEQNAEVLKHLAAIPEPADDAAELRPLLKAIIDIADALTLSLRQMEKFRDSVEPLLDDVASGGCEPPVPPAPGFFARLFGSRQDTPDDPERAKQAATKIRQLAGAAADGYALSLRRVERVLPTFELEPIPCTGEEFDPELMEVVEVVADSGAPPGTVVAEVRPGYQWRGKLFRFAQVKVAR